MKSDQEGTVIDEYIKTFPAEVQKMLFQIRAAIKEEIPTATEKIAFQIPTFFLKKNVIHFAGYPKHIGLYPTPRGVSTFRNELSIYKHTKGAIQFPLDKPLPIDLIKRIVRYLIAENPQ